MHPKHPGELSQDSERAAELAALPQLKPGRDAWPFVARQLRQPAVTGPWYANYRWLRPAMAAVLVLALGAITLLTQTVDEQEQMLQAWIAYSQELELELRQLRGGNRPIRGHQALAVGQLEDMVAVVDAQLAGNQSDDRRRLQLWQQRATLLNDLVTRSCRATAIATRAPATASDHSKQTNNPRFIRVVRRHLVMWKLLIFASALSMSGSAWAEQSEQDAESLRQEIREARSDLREAVRKLERLTERRSQYPRDARSFSFSKSGKRPMVGIIMNRPARDLDGVLLSGVTPDSPADKAGLQSGDLLTRIDHQDLSGRRGLDLANEILADLEIGDSFEFTYEREGESHTTTVVVEELEPSLAFSFSGNGDWFDFDNRPFNFGFSFDDETIKIDPQQFRDLADRYRSWSVDLSKLPRFKGPENLPYVWRRGWAWSGLELARVNAKLGRYFGSERGALVLEAQDLGDSDLQSGDVIVAIEGDDVSNPRQAMRLLGNFKAGEQITAQIMRDRKQREVVLIAPEPRSGSYFYSWSSEDD